MVGGGGGTVGKNRYEGSLERKEPRYEEYLIKRGKNVSGSLEFMIERQLRKDR